MKRIFLNRILHYLNLKDKNYRYQITVFVICLIISSLTWFLLNLSKEFYEEVSCPIQLSNLPNDMILVSGGDQNITLRIHGEGYNLITLSDQDEASKLRLSLDKYPVQKQGNLYAINIPTSRLKERLIQKFSNDEQIEHIAPDTLKFMLSKQHYKKVPIALKADFTLKKQYFISGDIQFEPAYIELWGTEDDLDKIDTIYSENVALGILSDSLKQVVPLTIPNCEPALRTSVSQAQVVVPIDQYTEFRAELPIASSGEPDGYKIKTFPNSVSITCLIPLALYKNCSANDFRAEVTYSAESQNTTNKLPVNIIHQPSFVKLTRVEPQKVEYYLLKQ